MTTVRTLLALAFLSALYPCIASYRKLSNQFSESSLFLFVGMAFYALTFLYGVVNGVTLQDLGMTSLGLPSEIGQLLVNVITAGLIPINVVMGLIIQKTRRPILYCLAFVIAVMAIISVLLVFVNGINPFVNFFAECCGIMAYFAWVLDLTYKEFCVIGNIYIQAAVCLMASIAPLMLCLRSGKGIGAKAICGINAVVHAVLFVVICAHYWMPLEPGFDLCYRELNQLASHTGTSYVFVNIVIFVIIFIADLIFNALLYKIVKVYPQPAKK